LQEPISLIFFTVSSPSFKKHERRGCKAIPAAFIYIQDYMLMPGGQNLTAQWEMKNSFTFKEVFKINHEQSAEEIYNELFVINFLLSSIPSRS
jgi:hypothetical protein